MSEHAFADADGDGIADDVDLAPSQPRGMPPSVDAANAHNNPLGNLLKGETVEFVITVNNPAGPAPSASDLTFFVNGTAEAAVIGVLNAGAGSSQLSQSQVGSSQRFVLSWTAKPPQNYPALVVQNLTLRFQDSEKATKWINLARIDVAEWEGKIITLPFVSTEESWAYTVLTHQDGMKKDADLVRRRGGENFRYRGPKTMKVIHLDGGTSELPLPDVAIPYLNIAGSPDGPPNVLEQHDYASLASSLDVDYVFNNGSNRPLRFDLSDVDISVTLSPGQSHFDSVSLANASFPFYTAAYIYYDNGTQWLPFYSSTWRVANNANANHRTLRSPNVLNTASGQFTTHTVTNYLSRQVKITPHAPGTLEYPGLPQESVTSEYDKKFMVMGPEDWRKVVIQIFPPEEHFTYSRGYRLNLGTGTLGNDAPQSGWLAQIRDGNDFVPLDIPVDGKIDILATNPVLYSQITSRQGLAIYLKRDATVDETHLLSLDILPIVQSNNPVRLGSLHLLPVEVVPDYNRDGKIDQSDRGQVSDDNPFRWWVNDDDDEGEAAGGKKAKGDIPNNGTADHQDNVVDGMRDLVDFFPLHLDIETLLDTLPAPEHTYRLKHSQGAFKFLEIPEIVPDGEPESDGAGSFIRSLARGESLAAEALKTASSSGENLTQAMLDALANGVGILLLEATKETTEPLQLEILKGSDSIATVDFPVRVSKVEDMYRHVDLRSIPTEYDGSAISAPASVNGTKTGDPGDPYPDELTNGKYFAFVHGYNVAQDKARGWHAETFKRLHQTGSKARYVGVVWQGDTGTDYHKAVFQAFQTGDQLNGAMSFVDGDLTIAAHSLGNMVVSQAVQNGGFAPDRYYLLNAAVAREAYGGNIPAAERTMMIEDGTQLGNNGPHFRKWRDYDGAGQSRLLSPEWHTLFPANDNRSKLKWNASFGNTTNLPLYNFYSPGDEVVRNPVDPTASALALILDRGFDFSTYAWANQEYVKGGTSLAGSFMERNQGGWVYNYDPPDPPEEGDPVPPETWDTGYFKYGWAGYRKYDEGEARDELTNAELRAKPFFKPFLELGLFDAANGSALAGQPNVKYDLLARGLPALSYAAAANPINGAQGNFDMEAQFRTDPQRWPLENHQSDEGGEGELWEGKWLHSDFKNVALSHVYQMFDQMIETGELDQ